MSKLIYFVSDALHMAHALLSKYILYCFVCFLCSACIVYNCNSFNNSTYCNVLYMESEEALVAPVLMVLL